MDERLENAPVGFLEIEFDGTVRAVNDAARELLGIEGRDVTDTTVSAVFPDSVEASVPRAFDTPPKTEQSLEEYYPGPDRLLSISLIPGEDAVYLYLQDNTTEHRQNSRLESVREDLDRLTMTNELIADILAELVAASTREEIAETICSQLGETEIYEFAWIGERELGSDDITMRASAGTTNRALDRIEAEIDGDANLPEFRAIESGEPEAVQPIGQDESVPEPIRRAAFADGLQSLLAVPLTYGSSVYGVVGIYTAEQDAFSERERHNFGTVGEMAGFAINATRHQSVLLSDTVVELTFQLTDPSAPFVAVASDLGVDMQVDGMVPEGDTIVCYLELENGSLSDISHALSETSSVHRTRTVAEYDDGGSIEVTLSNETPLGTLLTQGATLSAATYDDIDGRLVVELPPDEEIRRIAAAFTRDYDAEVLAKREREQQPTTTAEFRNALDGRLTERQRNALRTAFFADYFESPRGSTAEEVAKALGITGPTLLHHLRAGQRKLLMEFFETTDG